jgi:CRISPR-associated protein Csx10
MKALAIRIIAKSPLAIRADHAPGGARSANYIPGPTLVGCLADAYRRFNPDKTSDFEQLFLSEKVLFSGLYPAMFNEEIIPGIQEANDQPVYPLPKTAQSCKRHEGFRSPQENNAPFHGVHDSLIDWAIAKLGQKYGSKDPFSALREHKLCPAPAIDWSDCMRRTERVRAWLWHDWRQTFARARNLYARKAARFRA